MLDNLILSLREVSEQLIPIFTCIVLIFIIVLLRKSILLVKTIIQRVIELETTMKQVDKSIEKLQEPLNTAVKVSHGVDQMYDSTEQALKSASTYVVNQFNTMKDQRETKHKTITLDEIVSKRGE